MKQDDMLKVMDALNENLHRAEFRQAILNDANRTLKRLGITFEHKYDIRVHENTKTLVNVIVPAKKVPYDAIKPLTKDSTYGEALIWLVYQVQHNTEYKGRILKDAVEVLKSFNVNVIKGLKIKVYQNTVNVKHFALPNLKKAS